MLQLIYLGNGEIVRYQPDEADLLATERKVNALWQAIERAHQGRRLAASGPGRVWNWCAHQAICPAFGGTPPPLPADLPASLAEVPGVAEEAPPVPAAQSRPGRSRVGGPGRFRRLGSRENAGRSAPPARPRPDRHSGTGGTVSRYE